MELIGARFATAARPPPACRGRSSVVSGERERERGARGARGASGGDFLFLTVNPQEIAGRRITILLHAGAVHAFDSLCYHMGGPLGEGDIEDAPDGQCAVRCPSHGHRISLTTGARLEIDLEGHVCPSAPVQRVHQAVVDADGDVRLVLRAGPGYAPRASDKYSECGVVPGAPRGLGAFGAAPRVAAEGGGLEPYGGSVAAKHTTFQPAAVAPLGGGGDLPSLFRAARRGAAPPPTSILAPPSPLASQSDGWGSQHSALGSQSSSMSSPGRSTFAARGAAARAAVLRGAARPVPVAPRPRPPGQAALTDFFSPAAGGGGGGEPEAMET